jgi:hypothetical protein
MISERQLDANRRNAIKSHGPTTTEGRAAVRLNALKHGFTAAEIILPTVEEKIDFEQFRFAFEQEYNPVSPTEEVLVEDIVTARWRLNRIRKMEPGFFSLRLEVMNERIQDDFSALDPQAHLAFIVRDDAQSSDTLGKMSRYEARFERTFYKALKELQRLQALRAPVSDSGNGTVSQSPVSPDPEPPPPPESALPPPEPVPPPSESALPPSEPAPPPSESALPPSEPAPTPTAQASARGTDCAVPPEIKNDVRFPPT